MYVCVHGFRTCLLSLSTFLVALSQSAYESLCMEAWTICRIGRIGTIYIRVGKLKSRNFRRAFPFANDRLLSLSLSLKLFFSVDRNGRLKKAIRSSCMEPFTVRTYGIYAPLTFARIDMQAASSLDSQVPTYVRQSADTPYYVVRRYTSTRICQQNAW